MIVWITFYAIMFFAYALLNLIFCCLVASPGRQTLRVAVTNRATLVRLRQAREGHNLGSDEPSRWVRNSVPAGVRQGHQALLFV